MAAEQAAREAEEEAEREREKAKEKEGTTVGAAAPTAGGQKTAATDGKKTSKVTPTRAAPYFFFHF